MWLKLGDLYSSDMACYLLEGDEEHDKYEKEAIRCYVNALKEHIKEFPEPLVKLGSERFHKYELFKGIENLFNVLLRIEHPLIRLFPINRVEHFQIGLLKMYLEKNPRDAEALLSLARHYTEVMKLKEAEDACKRALEVDPKNPSVVREVSRIYESIAERTWRKEQRISLLNKAIELLRMCCRLEPESPYAWDRLAKIYSSYYLGEKRRIDEAIKCVKEAIKRRSTWGRWKTLGDLYFAKGEKEKMLECYAKAIDLKIKAR